MHMHMHMYIWNRGNAGKCCTVGVYMHLYMCTSPAGVHGRAFA